MINSNLFIPARCTALFILLLINACSLQTAGGSEIGNPVVMTGFVSDSLGNGVADVVLYITSPHDTKPPPISPNNQETTVTDASGRYSIEVLSGTERTVYGSDTTGTSVFMRSIYVSPSVSDDTIDAGSDTLRKAAHVVVALTHCTSGRQLLYIPGTTMQAATDSCGELVISCPPLHPFDLMLKTNDSIVKIADNLTLAADAWLDLTGKQYTLPVPRIASGLLSGIANIRYTFIADPISLGSNHPIEYRFDWGDSLSKWTLSNENAYLWMTPGEYLARVQARSVRDTLSVSLWSDAVGVAIRAQEP